MSNHDLDAESADSGANSSGDESDTHHCPYCGEDDVSASHVLDCQPFDIGS